ncbi:MAG: pyridoxal-dependent decarboxylase [Gemmatimonadota bacterium]|nr:pyridoxal-dependent decarboxylase [Gemmatimonadota bacterium]
MSSTHPRTDASDPSTLGDIPAEEFTRHADALTRWITEYLRSPERYPVLARVAPGEVLRTLPDQAPEGAESLDAILADIDRLIMPGVTHWNHPGFLAYFANTASVPGILGEMLTAALNQNGILWRTSPALAELEETTTGWLRDAFGLPPDWFGMITDTASVSTLQALAAAREMDPALEIRRRGMSGRPELPRLRIYCSEHAHSSVDKAAITLGIGAENVVRLPADDRYRLRVDALEAALVADRATGYRPLAVVATLGTTSTTSVDPIAGIAAICRRERLWLHADAAYGGPMLLLPEGRALFAGVEHVDSMVVNPHKWLFTPMDCSVLWTRHRQVLKRTFALTPAYLETEEQEIALSHSDYSFQLGRRFRALKLWFVIRAFGVHGLAARVRHHCSLATTFAAWVHATEDWEVVAPVEMSVVCFRHVPVRFAGNEPGLAAHNSAILDRVNASGRVFLSHTKLGARYVLRVAVGNLRTEERHLAEAWQLLREGAGAV